MPPPTTTTNPPTGAAAAAAAAAQDLYVRLQQTLADPRMEVRRKAQGEWIEHVRSLMPNQRPTDPERAMSDAACAALRGALDFLRNTYLRSTNEKSRKLGILLMKELLIAKPAQFRLPDDIVKYLVTLHLHLLNDKNEEVRSQALDLLKMIVLNIRPAVYLCFSDILTQLVSIMPTCFGNEKDQATVRLYNAIEDLTRSMLNVVNLQLQPAHVAPEFDMSGFIGVVRESLVKHKENPTVCAFVTTTCIKNFRDVEGVHIFAYLHEYLGELLELLTAGPQTAAQALAALRETLPSVTSAFRANLEAAATGGTPQPTANRVQCMIAVLNVMQPKPTHSACAKTCLQWLSELTQNADDEAEIALLPLLHRMVQCVVPMCGDKEARMQNDRLAVLATKYGGDPAHQSSIQFEQLLVFLRGALEGTAVRLPVLNWIALVHGTHQAVCDAMIDGLNADVLRCLSDGSEEVARKALEVLCGLARNDEARWEKFARQLLELIADSRQQLATRIPMTIKQLQAQAIRAGFPPEFVLCTVARLLAQHNDRYFITSVVTTLSMMLITAPELAPVRHGLKRGTDFCGDDGAQASSSNSPRGGGGGGRRTFTVLYACWAYNSVWALALCLLAREYHQAHRIVSYMASCDPSAHTLVQLDRLLQLLETPAFAYLRNALTVPRECPYLVRTLYSVLMILPQTSPQFHTLLTRLQCASQLQATLTADCQDRGAPPATAKDDEAMFKLFTDAQAALQAAEAPRPAGGARGGTYDDPQA